MSVRRKTGRLDNNLKAAELIESWLLEPGDDGEEYSVLEACARKMTDRISIMEKDLECACRTLELMGGGEVWPRLWSFLKANRYGVISEPVGEVNWRYEFAGRAMQAIISNGYFLPENVTQSAIKLADALIEELEA